MNKPTRLELYLKSKNVRLIRLYENILKRGASMSYQTLWNVYHGRTAPKLETMQKIASTLGVELSTVFDI